MRNFNEDSRVKFPTIKHLMEMGYQYISFKGLEFNSEGRKVILKEEKVEPQTNILTDRLQQAYLKLNPNRSDEEFNRLLKKIIGVLNNDDLGKQFYQEILLNSDVLNKMLSCLLQCPLNTCKEISFSFTFL